MKWLGLHLTHSAKKNNLISNSNKARQTHFVIIEIFCPDLCQDSGCQVLSGGHGFQLLQILSVGTQSL